MDEGRVSHQIRQDYELRTLASDLETRVLRVMWVIFCWSIKQGQ